MLRRLSRSFCAAALLGATSLSWSLAPSARADVPIDQLGDSDPNAGIQYSTAPDAYAAPVEQTSWYGPWDPAGWIGYYGCQVPSVGECLDPSFASTQCGQLDTWVATTWPGGSPCQFVVGNAVGNWLAQSGIPAHLDVFSDGRWFSTTEVPTQDEYTYFYQGSPTSYLDEQLSVQLEAKNPAAGQLSPDFRPKAIRRGEWEANGPAVASCREFVWEKWYDWSRFEDATGGIDGSFGRFVFDRAFDPATGIFDRVIRSRDGAPQKRVVFPTDVMPKNAYFLFEPSVFDRYPIDPSLLPTPAGRNLYTASWDWHRSMSTALSGTPDAVLASEYQRQVSFKKLLAKRASILAAIVEEAGGAPPVLSTPVSATLPFSVAATFGADTSAMTAFGLSSSAASATAVSALSPSVVSSTISSASTTEPISTVVDPLAGKYVTVDTGGYTGRLAQLYLIDKSLVAYLEHARDVGCLTTGAPSVCDWSPDLFAEQLRSQFSTERERDLQTCLEKTADDFSPGAVIHDPGAHGVPSAIPGWDYAADSERVRAFFAIYDIYVRDYLDFTPEPGSTTEASKGWWKYDKKKYGKESWNVGYEYKLGWGLQKNTGAKAGLCDADLRVQGMANATATLAGHEIKILDGDNYLYSEGSLFHAHGHLKVLGKAIYDTGPELTSSVHLRPLEFKLSAKPSVSAMVWIAFVPVTITVGISGEAGIDTDLAATLTRACTSSDTGTLDLAATATLAPFVSVAAFGSVGAGVKGFLQAKIEVQLDLLRLSVPLSLTVNLAPTSAALSSLQLVATARLDLFLKTMSGRVLGVLESLFGDTSVKIFEWEGLDPIKEPGWSKTWKLPVASVIGKI